MKAHKHAAIGDLFDPPETRPLASEGLLYSGDRNGPIPKALYTDSRLTPLERNAWQLFYMTLAPDGVTPLPTYEQLQPYMTTMPCGARASSETIARALTLLRLSRWMTLFEQRRDRKTGKLLKHLYVLHDAPLAPADAVRLDPQYLPLVCQSLHHASKAVQRVARQVVQEVLADVSLKLIALPEHIKQLVNQVGVPINEKTFEPTISPGSESTAVASTPKPGISLSIAQTSSPRPQSPTILNPKSPRSTERKQQKPSTEATTDSESSFRASRHPTDTIRLPQLFNRLKPGQQSELQVPLRRLDRNVQQAVLDEWSERCEKQQVRNPAGYLYGILQKALRGEFKPWAASAKPPTTARCAPTTGPAHTLPENTRRQHPELARTYLAELRTMLNLPTQHCPTPG
ncbi:STY4528 family pathogenicity island replication protein [Pseudomonas putida]|uniref:STY4528 family pathogenicity island replication protein n=1 Tax=Pseudomonas putida TaxID=303 RepID=UPI000A5A9916|nr:STY4528 family pathogenicity island replication protein [Pseudomonas putida]